MTTATIFGLCIQFYLYFNFIDAVKLQNGYHSPKEHKNVSMLDNCKIAIIDCT
jgi:hypothetical protein